MSILTKKYPCQFCGAEFPGKSSRRTHNGKCDKNVDREKNQVASAEGQKKVKKQTPRRMSRMERQIQRETLDIIGGDLSDGAYFAMAEEMGLDIEDFYD